MFEHKTIQSIFDDLMLRVPDEMDKRPSSLVYSDMMALAIELKQLYIDADYVLKNAFADTADREHLIKIAREMSIIPLPATSTIVEARFNINVGLGARFNAGLLNFWLSKQLGQKEDGLFYAELTCEQSGLLNDENFIGRITPITVGGVADKIEGLTLAEITRIIERGEDEEDTEVFRKRYFDSTRWEHYGGNIADYQMMCRTISGIGGVKVIPVWNGGGTVKLVITDSANKIPSQEFVAKVKEEIDPVGFEGLGHGKAPIDHLVTIEAPQAATINIGLHLTYETGQSWQTVEKDVKAVIEKYFDELRERWAESSGLIVRSAYIEARLLDLPGIKDIADTTLNGSTSNVSVDEYAIPVVGEVTAV